MTTYASKKKTTKTAEPKPAFVPTSDANPSSTASTAKPKADTVPMVTIKNKLPRSIVLNVTTKEHRVKRKFPVVRQLKNGGSVGELETRLCADSLTLLARETKSVPRSMLASVDIQNAIAAGKILVIEKRAS